MFEAVKNALADYGDLLEFQDEPTRILVRIVKFMSASKFGEIKSVVMNFDPKYYPYNKATKTPAYWVIQKGRRSFTTQAKVTIERAKPPIVPEMQTLVPKVSPEATITVNYHRKVSTPIQFEMLSIGASLEVPAKDTSLEEAYLTVMDFVERKVAERLKELEQQ
jgi:hypothetical protein